MILYHGSNIAIEEVDLCKSRPGKDFGVGFYLSEDESQAKEMAAKKALLFGGEPTVTLFEFDEKGVLVDSAVKYKRFEHYCLEWGEFIKLNRDNRTREQLHDYDIVIGPVADDGVVLQLNLYMQRLITMDMLVRELTYHKLNNQYYFGTERAIKYLRRL